MVVIYKSGKMEGERKKSRQLYYNTTERERERERERGRTRVEVAGKAAWVRKLLASSLWSLDPTQNTFYMHDKGPLRLEGGIAVAGSYIPGFFKKYNIQVNVVNRCGRLKILIIIIY